jgi:putative nucleotidyltransferase with HDIG domain
MPDQLTLKYKRMLEDYLSNGLEESLYQVAEFGKDLMKKKMGPEFLVEIHFNAIKIINEYSGKHPTEDIERSFTFLMEGVTAYGLSFSEYVNFKEEGYLSEIRGLNKKLNKRLTEMVAIHETVKVAGSTLNMDKVLQSIFNNAVKTLKAENGSLMLYDPLKKVLTIKNAYGLSKDIITKTKIQIGKGVSGLVAQNGKSVIINKRINILNVKGRKKYEKVYSICAPLNTKKGLVGVINLNRNGYSQPFTVDDLNLLSTMASEAASAIENASLYKDLQNSYLSTIRALTSALEVKNPYTKGHSDVVAELALALAQSLKLAPEEIEGIEAAAILHDIGKIGISEDILNKPGKLNEEEWREIKMHPEYSNKILEGINFPWDIKPIIYAHHERYDGKGYPQGLKGDAIPLGAKILAVVDSYNAMTSDRPYRKGFSVKEAMKELKKFAGTQFDPVLVEKFIEIISENFDKTG